MNQFRSKILRLHHRSTLRSLAAVKRGSPRETSVRVLLADRPITVRMTFDRGRRRCGRRPDLARCCRQRMRSQPQRMGRDGWINSSGTPPCGFIAAAVDLAMVSSAQRDSEFIADLASECAVLCEPQVVGVRRSSAANQTILWLGPATPFQ
jgi:hypothetical protein